MITLTAASNAVVMEGNGWPLGLGNINSRITAPGASQPPPPPQPAVASRLRHISSFSSLSSSDLDTESTASFFPDQSVQLGRLIGIRPIGGNENSGKEANVGDDDEGSRRGGHSPQCDSEGFCTPLLQHVLGRIFRRPKHNLLSLLSQ